MTSAQPSEKRWRCLLPTLLSWPGKKSERHNCFPGPCFSALISLWCSFFLKGRLFGFEQTKESHQLCIVLFEGTLLNCSKAAVLFCMGTASLAYLLLSLKAKGFTVQTRNLSSIPNAVDWF